MPIKQNYLQAIKWIDEQLTKSTRQIKIGGEIIHDLNFSLAINRNHIQMNIGQLSYAAFMRTKKIKDFLTNEKT